MEFGKKGDAKKAMKLMWKEGITLKQAWKKVQSKDKKSKSKGKKKAMSPKKRKAVANAKKAMKLKWKEGITLKQAWKKVNKFGDSVCPPDYEPNPGWTGGRGQRQCIQICGPGMYRDPVTNRCKKVSVAPVAVQIPDGMEINPATGRLRKICLQPNVRNARGRCIKPRTVPVLQPGMEINPATGRLRKICLQPNVRNARGRCIKPRAVPVLQPGMEINPATGRLRKMCLPGQYRDPVSGKCRKVRTSPDIMGEAVPIVADVPIMEPLLAEYRAGGGIVDFGKRYRFGRKCSFGGCGKCG